MQARADHGLAFDVAADPLFSTSRSFDVSTYDFDQFFGGFGTLSRLQAGRSDVLTHVSLHNLGKQRVQRAAACSDALQHGRAFAILLQRALDGAHLARQAVNAVEQFLLASPCM
jgi:hypothetical protein